MKKTIILFISLFISLTIISCTRKYPHQHNHYTNVKTVFMDKKYKRCFTNEDIQNILYQKGLKNIPSMTVFPFDENMQGKYCYGLWLVNYSSVAHGYFHAIKVLHTPVGTYVRRGQPLEDAERMFNDYLVEETKGHFADTSLLRMRYSFLKGDIYGGGYLPNERYAPLDSIKVWLEQLQETE
jgi:hypothetical protein